MRIGIAPPTTELVGGTYQYAQTMLSVLAALRETRDEEIVVLADGIGPDAPVLAGARWELASLTPAGGRQRTLRAVKRLARERLSPARRDTLVRMAGVVSGVVSRGADAPPPDVPRRRPGIRAWLESLRIDLVVYPAPTTMSFEIGIPYVMAVHDLQHRLQSDFPEFASDGGFARREYLFRNAIREATIVLTDSAVGREDVLDLYGELIDPERVAVLPFLPPPFEEVTPADRARVRSAHRLPDRYLFYPAHLWPHKNHARIVDALDILRRDDGIELDLVLVGSTSGQLRARNYAELTARVRALGLDERVRHLGYVPERDMPALYAEALALVMPTFFGPTNIPVLEAWSLDCPVITSDIRGVREQAEDAALLVDPASAPEIADAIRRLVLDEGLRDALISRGRARLAAYTRDDYAQRLSAILDQAAALLEAPRDGAGG